jgi:hypothetical protein
MSGEMQDKDWEYLICVPNVSPKQMCSQFGNFVITPRVCKQLFHRVSGLPVPD